MGFMGSGKTTLGPLLARELEWDFRDVDREVEERTGRTIARIFAEEGEEAFREIEDRAARSLLARERVVLATGGGWPCRPGRLEALPAGTLAVWLRVSPSTAVRRSREEPGARPLLEASDPERRARELLDLRIPYYRMAHWSVDTEAAPPDELARRLAERLGKDPERPLRD